MRATYPICFPLVLGRLRVACCNRLLRWGRGCTRIQLFPGNGRGDAQRFALGAPPFQSTSLDSKAKARARVRIAAVPFKLKALSSVLTFASLTNVSPLTHCVYTYLAVNFFLIPKLVSFNS